MPYLKAENEYAEAFMKDSGQLQEQLYCEMKARLIEDESTLPAKKGNYYYYNRFEKGASYPLHCRKKDSLEGPEEIILDENALAGSGYFNLEAIALSKDQTKIAFSYDHQGNELNTLKIKDLSAGKIFDDMIYPTMGNAVWSSDGTTLFYMTPDPVFRADKVWRHVQGTPSSSDVLVYEEKDPKFSLSLRKSKDEKLLFIRTESRTTGGVLQIPLEDAMSEPEVIVPLKANVKYDVESYGNTLLILTDEEAPNNKVVLYKNGRMCDFVAHRDTVLIENMEVFCGTLVLFIRENFKQLIELVDIKTGTRRIIRFDEPTYEIYSGSNLDFASTQLRFHFTSPITPERIYDYDISRRTMELKKQKQVPCFCPEDYTSTLIFAEACDGAKIPISLVWKKGCVKGLLLTGYGAYGISYPLPFSSKRLSLLDRGVAFAVAHVRGGQEGGRQWYEQAKMLCKKTTFTDFISAAEKLIKMGITTPDHLVIEGRSAGGLLIGAVVNMRPDLFRAAIAGVPFVDALNTMLDPTIPLTISEYEEWGNPEEKEAYDYIKSYAPYENVEAKCYPALLIEAGINDPRVGFWEPAKWAAKLRALKTDSAPLLLKTELGGGHFGKSGRYDALCEEAFKYAFILKIIQN